MHVAEADSVQHTNELTSELGPNSSPAGTLGSSHAYGFEQPSFEKQPHRWYYWVGIIIIVLIFVLAFFN